ncbi:uncharacterized protein [Miscanthus floridulus]|uniref:uncharacterized protein n=1 Tax=Miscanthus floridulus TaxID=154761 RepID=UPI003457B4BC
MASSQGPVSAGLFTNNQYKPSVRYKEPEQTNDGLPALGLGANQPVAPSNLEVMELDEDPVAEHDPLVDWRMPYLDYLLHEALPMDKTEARRLTCLTKSFVSIEGELYRRSHTGILLHCIPIEQGKQLLSDIHGGVCAHHTVPRTLVEYVFQQSFY